MKGWRLRAAALAGAAAALLQAGCASTPTAAPGAPALPGGVAAEQLRVSASQGEAARKASEAGRLREALWRWRIVEAVSNDKAATRRSADALQSRIAQDASAAVERGDAARRAHNDTAAVSAYRQALLLVPDHAGALRQLRELETGTVLKDVNREQEGARHKRTSSKASKPKAKTGKGAAAR